MVFYLDLILLLNFVIDYFILLATGRYLYLTIRHWHLMGGALLGAAYTLVFFVPELSFINLFITKFILSILMILITYGFIHIMRFLKILAVFYLVSFITGGGVFALQYFFNINHDIVNGIYITRSGSPIMVIILILVGFIGILLFSNKTFLSITRRYNIQVKIVDVEIEILNFNYQCKGLIDTGNQLYDPITRKPVMILEAIAADFIPLILKKAYQDSQFQLDLFDKITDQIEPIWLSRIHIVPFKSIAKQMQFILTIRPDKVVIKAQGEEKIYNHSKVLIGLNYGNLSNDQSYQAIIHPELLAG